jgi:hypothetical protein
MLQAAAKSHSIGQHDLHITASMGVSRLLVEDNALNRSVEE